MEKKADRNDKLKVLCLEDSPQDVELMRELLTEAGFELDMDCTMVEEEFVSFLRRSIYDIILADFKLPGFDAFGALRHAAEICPEVPFICVSGTIGEESAVKLLRQGAVDYVLKDRMTRLPAAIKRALIEAKEKLLHKQAEEALNLEYSRHKRFVDSNIVGVVIAAANGKILEANDYYLNMLGFTRREFESGKIDWRAITPTESLPADEKAIRELHERGTCTPYEKEYRRKDGTIVPVFLADTLLPGPEEQIGAFVLDITERKRAEESIRKSESQLRAVLDATRFPVALVDVSDKNIEYWSRSALTLFGHTAPTTKEWYKMAYPDPDYRREVIDRWKQSLEKAKLSAQAVNTGEFRVTCRDGSVRICELYAAFLADRLIVTFNDITERIVAIKNLRESEAKYRTLVTQSPDGIFVVDLSSHFLSVNNAMCDNLKYSEEEFLSMNIWDIVPRQYLSLHKNRLEAVLKGESEKGTAEYEAKGKDGVVHIIEVLSAPYYRDKEKIGFQGIARDITERKRMENATRESEERFQLVFENVFDGISIYSEDPDPSKRRLIECNAQYAAMAGRSREELLQIGFTLGFQKMLDDEANSHRLQSLAKISAFQGFYSWIRPDGKDNIVEYVGVPIMWRGKSYTIGIDRDISERKLMEEELRKSEERFRSLYENSTIGIYRTTPEGKIILANPTLVKMLGYSSFEELAARNLEQEGFEPAHERKQFIEQIETNGEVHGLESAWTCNDGSTVYIRESARAIRDPNGKTLYYDGSVEDISERKLAEDAFNRERNLLNALMDTIPDHIYFKDLNSRFLRVNKSHGEIFGLNDPKQAQGKTDFDFFTEEHARPAFETEQEIIKTGRPVVGLEEKETWLDGRETWVSTTKVPLYDKDGKITGTFGISRDITDHKLMQEELRKNEERFRKIFEESQIGVMLSDPDFRYIKVNPAFCNMLGYTASELASMSFIDITHPDDIGKDIENMSKLKIGEIPFYRTEKRYLRKTGEIVWVNIVISGIRNNDGTLLYHLGMIENNTQRKQEEQEINRLNRIYAVLSNINQLIVREGDRQTLLNEACEIAVQDGEFQMSWVGIFDAETDSFQPVASAAKESGYREQLHTSIAQIMAGREPLWRTLIDGQIIICNDIEHDDRLKSQREKTLALGCRSLAAFPLQIDDEIIGVVNFYSSEKDFFNEEELKLLEELASDVSYALHSLELENKRTQAEKETQESENKYRRIFENVQDVYYEALIDGTILEISPSIEMISKKQYNRDELIGKSMNEFYPNKGERQAFLSALQERGSVVDYEVTLKNRDGSIIPCSISAKLQFDAQGNPEKIIGSIIDITERKLYQSQLMQSQKVQSIGTLAGGIAHDFNNILGIILVFTSILEQSKGDEEKISKSTATIIQAVNRGAALVRQILTFARQTGVSMKPLRIPDLIRELVVMLKETFPAVIEFQTNVEMDIPIINADQSQMHQVLLNLCINARDAMPKGGIIGIEVKTVASERLVPQFSNAENCRYISISVSDTGTGMDEETKNRIFDPFFTTKEQGKGTGLGLSVVYGVIQEHHGFISVESTVGQGTTFHIYLPMQQEEKKMQEAEKVKTEMAQGGSETILFVEDELLLREVVQSTLESIGYKVIIAANGQEAVDIYKKQFKNISLVLSDLGLPKLSGTDEFALLKKINPNVKVIFASGYISIETKSELLKQGAKGFILKPYNLNEVLQMVREVLNENKNLSK